MGPVPGIARRAAANVARAGRRLVARSALPRRGSPWLVLRVSAPLEEVSASPFTGDTSLSVLALLENLDAAATDVDIHGVLLRLEGGPIGWSKTLSLRRALDRVRETGKPVAVYADSLEAQSFLLASAATRIWLPETGQLFLVGLRSESFYLRGLLSKLEIEPEVVHIGHHKTAGQRLTRDRMSPEEREQADALADDVYEALVEGIAKGRGLAPSAVKELIDAGPYSAQSAEKAGLIDGCLYPDELDEALAELTPVPGAERPGPRRPVRVDGALYHALRGRDPGWQPLRAGLPRIAYVVARGAIHRSRESGGIALAGLGDLLERLQRQEGVRGVVLRIDSPGGDALASDRLWRLIRRLGREKPVVVSMAEVAASGGYYLAAGADAVFAEATSVTGSIGVVGGKLNLAGLYERLGIHPDGVERGARAGLLSGARAFTGEERHALRGELSRLYEIFVDRVAEGRRLEPRAVDRVAQGRVWSGARALSVGLVDALGGPLEALAEVRRRAGLRAAERVLLEIYPRLPRIPSLRTLLRWLR